MSNTKLSRQLIRGSESFLPENVAIIGNGAIRNGWDPVIETFTNYEWKSKDLQRNIFKYANKSNGAHCLSIISFLYRILRDGHFVNPSNDEELTIKLLEEISQFKKELCLSFQKMQKTNHIALNSDLKKITSYFNQYNAILQTGFVTINWDELIWEKENDLPNLIQLHGRVSIPESLIFPTELCIDGKIINLVLKKNLYEFNENTYEVLARNGIYDELSLNHQTCLNWLENAKRVVFWGIKFNEYDSELNSILFSINWDKIEEITIIDKEYSARRDFLSNLLNLEEAKFREIAPDSL